MSDFAITVGVLDVTDSCKPGEETMGDIDGDISPWAKVSDILINKVSG